MYECLCLVATNRVEHPKILVGPASLEVTFRAPVIPNDFDESYAISEICAVNI